MKSLAWLLISMALFAVGASAQVIKLPKFGQYPAKIEAARVKTIDFKHNPDAKAYRTRLSAAVRRGVNFAGHYIITGWGCGTGCTNAVIIEGRSGDVIWPSEFTNIDASYGEGYSDKQLDFRKNSRLLIIHGVPGSAEDQPVKSSGDHYYEWKGNKLHLLRSIPKATN